MTSRTLKAYFIVLFLLYSFSIYSDGIGLCTSGPLRIRSDNNLSSEIVGRLQTYERFIIIDRSEDTQVIDDIDAYWYQIETNDDITGWVFGGYIAILRNEDNIVEGKIFTNDYDDVKDKCVSFFDLFYIHSQGLDEDDLEQYFSDLLIEMNRIRVIDNRDMGHWGNLENRGLFFKIENKVYLFSADRMEDSNQYKVLDCKIFEYKAPFKLETLFVYVDNRNEDYIAFIDENYKAPSNEGIFAIFGIDDNGTIIPINTSDAFILNIGL